MPPPENINRLCHDFQDMVLLLTGHYMASLPFNNQETPSKIPKTEFPGTNDLVAVCTTLEEPLITKFSKYFTDF